MIESKCKENNLPLCHLCHTGNFRHCQIQFFREMIGYHDSKSKKEYIFSVLSCKTNIIYGPEQVIYLKKAIELYDDPKYIETIEKLILLV